MKKPEQMGLGLSLAVVLAIVVLGGYAAMKYHFIPERRRGRRNRCISNLRQIRSGKEQWAFTCGATDGQIIGWSVMGEYIRGGATRTFCPLDKTRNPTNSYRINPIGTDPECKIVTSGKYGHEL